MLKPLNEKDKLTLWQSVAHEINEAAFKFLSLNGLQSPIDTNDYRTYARLRGGLRTLCAFSSPSEVDEAEGAFETWATRSSSTLQPSSKS
jgi:hypothetical protein